MSGVYRGFGVLRFLKVLFRVDILRINLFSLAYLKARVIEMKKNRGFRRAWKVNTLINIERENASRPYNIQFVFF